MNIRNPSQSLIDSFGIQILCLKRCILSTIYCAVVALVPMVATSSEVDERALYDLAPENSSFVRLINLTESPQRIRLDKVTLSVPSYCSASGYKPINAGKYPLQLGKNELMTSMHSNLAYSLVVDKSGVTLVADTMVKSPRKSLVSVYNFTSVSDLFVKTADGKHSVFSSLASGDRASREINPVKVNFAVFSEAEKLSDVDATIFERGVVSTLLLCGDKDSMQAQWVRQ